MDAQRLLVWAMCAGVVISGRVHPGESNASWIVHGILQFLMTDHPETRWLLSRYVFKVRRGGALSGDVTVLP